MKSLTLDAALARYREALGAAFPDGAEIERFRGFLEIHGGLGRPGTPPRDAAAAARLDRLRCFHFSQYLDWYLQEKEGLAASSVEEARAAMRRLNEWLFGAGLIGPEDFEENRESILGGEDLSALDREEGSEDDATPPGPPEEKDFHVPGEYTAVLSGEFVLTKVQEGILYGRRDGEAREIGPILVERSVSGGHRVGDRVHLAVGKAGDHWNLLSVGPRPR
ncbi:MAG TPA: hypothetical protein VGR67_03145 [Candidatus Polarisedimenticolia bacterium]|nr:hypothetical protein [Candidatus Polarisedimenticolia bacterium]